MPEKLTFRVSSGLKDIIGKDLITDDYVAVFELVKNSYDAKANKVIITFEQDKIIIADNGKGMSSDDVKNKWLFVAYSAKKDGTEDKIRSKTSKKNYYAGAKGIGRFSSDRLGKILNITTKTSDAKKCEYIAVDWHNFEKDQKEEFINIHVEYEQKQFVDIFPMHSRQGTILEINKLNNTWNREKLKELKHSLEKLINPFSKPSDFSIEIICNHEKTNDKIEEHKREKINGIIENSILDVLKLKTTKIDVRVTAKDIRTEIIDRGTEIYKLRESNTKFKLLDDVKISIYYLNKKAKINFTNLMGIQPINYGSIFLYKNGFRVYPFGNKGDDSWGLDYRAQQRHSSRLSTRDLFGKVEITTDNTQEFKEVTSRDGGLVKTEGSDQLMAIFDKTHRYLERYVSGVLWGKDFLKIDYFEDGKIAQENRQYLLDNDWENDDISVIKKSIGSKLDYIQLIKGLVKDKNIFVEYYNKDLLDIITERLNEIKPKYIKDLVTIADKTNNQELKEKIFQAEKELNKLKAENEKKDKELAKEKELREEAEKAARDARLAQENAEKKAAESERQRRNAEKSKKQTEGELKQRIKQNLFLQSVQTLDVERVINYHHDIGIQASTIENWLKSITKSLNNGILDLEEIKQTIEVITLSNNKILAISHFATKANFNSTSEKIYADIIVYIEQYIDSIREYFTKLNINFINKKDIELKMKFIPIEISVMLDNLFNNSIKAKAKNIFIEVNRKDKSEVVITFTDDGNGLPKEIKTPAIIFEKGFTTTNGSGLGLYYVSQFVNNELKGSLEINSKIKQGFQLKVVIKDESGI
jgi:signal transduction histidine kinase